jgi:hypothetical protein
MILEKYLCRIGISPSELTLPPQKKASGLKALTVSQEVLVLRQRAISSSCAF